jgi:hypothetical protein
MEYKKPNNLLSTNNAKTIKGEKLGIKTYILYLSPFNQNSKGINICPMATLGCASACLYGSGHGSMSNVKKGRTNKTEFFLADRNLFIDLLYIEIATIALKHKLEGTSFVFRLNGTSDISWEKFKLKRTGKNLFDSFPDVQFYDYTKNHTRFDKVIPNNYRLIFSRSENNELKSLELIIKGINVAIVFDKLPDTYKGFTVIDGDINDLRHLDPHGVIVGLKYKRLTGRGVNNSEVFESGFGIRVAA